MKVLHVAAEVFPLVKTGGLADVVGALPQALIKAGADVRLVIPGFDAVLKGVLNRSLVAHIGAVFGAAKVALYIGELANGVTTYVVDAPYLYAGRQNPYLDPHGQEWPDNLQRYCLLGWVAAQLAAGKLDSTWQPSIVHAHDWHAATVCAYLATHPANQVKSVFTIHNLAYQGLFAASEYHHTTLPNDLFVMDGLEYHGKLSLIKAGLVYADRITTVSPTYAREIATPEFGHGLDGMIRARGTDVSGILNGVDRQVWDPATDALLKAFFTADQMQAKALCKAALQEEFGLSVNAKRPLLCVVSRLTSQKGIDLLTAIVPKLVDELGVQLIVQGQGDKDLEAALSLAMSTYHSSVAVRLGYDEGAAHRIIGGADAILVPSRFEPCGLTQLYGLRYGTLPIVSEVGGLVDTVVGATEFTLKNQTATGFSFSEISGDALFDAILQAVKCYRDKPTWNQLMARAMSQNFSWESAASQYLVLYELLVTDRK